MQIDDQLSYWLDVAVSRLRHQFDPHQILLFGSWARGTATRRSDIDLLIICETTAPPLERIDSVLKLLRDAPSPIEAIVYTPAELERRQSSPFIRRVLQEGIVLYERGKTSAGC
ncbi:MAG: nucleotidyltransferase domain-containing protein [Elainellaceae cyanobacterium]